VLVPATSGVSYLVFNYRRREEEPYERIKRLAKRYVWNKMTKEVFDRRIEALKESDANKRVLIDEYLPHVMALVRAEKAMEERKVENRGKGKKSSVF
jgi:hypothetical protein